MRFSPELYRQLADCGAPITLAAEDEPFDTLILIDLVKGDVVGHYLNEEGNLAGTAREDYSIYASVINIANKTYSGRALLNVNQPPKIRYGKEQFYKTISAFDTGALKAFITKKGIINLPGVDLYNVLCEVSEEGNGITVMENRAADGYVSSYTENYTPEQLYDCAIGDEPCLMTPDELYKFVTNENVSNYDPAQLYEMLGVTGN